MKKITTVLFIFSIFAVPAVTSAKTLEYTIPDGAVGVTEVQYQEIKNATCGPMEPVCGELVDSLVGKVIFRAEHLGEMYIVSEKVELPSPILRRYLPNGFYKTGKGSGAKYFLVQDAYKIPLKENKAFHRIQGLIAKNQFVPISENNFKAMGTICEYLPEVNPDRSGFDNCVKEAERGRDLFHHLWGKLIMRVENNGELYYVNPFDNNASALIQIWDPMPITGEAFFDFVKQNSASVPASVLKQIDSGKYRYY